VARYRSNPCLVAWFEQNALSAAWELLVVQPRETGNPTYNCNHPWGTFPGWLSRCLYNGAVDYCREKHARVVPSDPKRFEDKVDRACRGNDTADNADRLSAVKAGLHAGLVALSRTKSFQAPTRSNGVDYFVVLLLVARIQMAKLLFKFLRENDGQTDCGEEMVKMLRHLWPEEPAWQSRRLVSWGPAFGALCEGLEKQWRCSNRRPLVNDVVAELSRLAGAPSINDGLEIYRARWATWTARARAYYHREAVHLSEEQRQILDCFILGEEEDDSTIGEKEVSNVG
ncbi:MAG: hypothetical protein NZM42_06560, partial [Gemmatales bacterium]|nr:hypothetical protein [Gemmatales bacterium]